jgi:hypothetical protein
MCCPYLEQQTNMGKGEKSITKAAIGDGVKEIRNVKESYYAYLSIQQDIFKKKEAINLLAYMKFQHQESDICTEEWGWDVTPCGYRKN